MTNFRPRFPTLAASLATSLSLSLMLTGCGGSRQQGNPTAAYAGQDITALAGKERAKMVETVAPLTGDADEPLPGQGPQMIVDLKGGVTAVVSKTVTATQGDGIAVTRIASDGRVDWQWQLALPAGWSFTGQSYRKTAPSPTQLIALSVKGSGKTARIYLAPERRPLLVRIEDQAGNLALGHAWKDLPELDAGRGSLQSSDPIQQLGELVALAQPGREGERGGAKVITHLDQLATTGSLWVAEAAAYVRTLPAK